MSPTSLFSHQHQNCCQHNDVTTITFTYHLEKNILIIKTLFYEKTVTVSKTVTLSSNGNFIQKR